ncbi:peptidoglycan DD-metalloendopeptidase family protein [Clostridium sp. J1101437_171009_A5]|uniref:peptidoglycan DD-metalloendopeptidase family protein n=1 Tax=Clostridium sp. J1101437_171009_A5 TaxID=2787098 RepID=UPI00189BBC3A|nr:peptidoglycan DD-metalloendopeptidase family protein [Clostridium sp. J1101437_171009_A5]
MKEPWKDRIGDFMAGKGFYIVLFLCVAAIGISGYYLLANLDTPSQELEVAGKVQVTVTPPPAEHSLSPQKPAVSTRPSPQSTARPSATPAPTRTPAPSAAQKETETSTAFVWPVEGETIHPYSVETLVYDQTMGDWRTHEGVDLAAPVGSTVCAAAAGTVVSVHLDDLMGTTVTVEHADGLRSVYANLAEETAVTEGATVQAGDPLGSVGESAIAESALAPHLHFALWQGDAPLDPGEYLPAS